MISVSCEYHWLVCHRIWLDIFKINRSLVAVVALFMKIRHIVSSVASAVFELKITSPYLSELHSNEALSTLIRILSIRVDFRTCWLSCAVYTKFVP